MTETDLDQFEEKTPRISPCSLTRMAGAQCLRHHLLPYQEQKQEAELKMKQSGLNGHSGKTISYICDTMSES